MQGYQLHNLYLYLNNQPLLYSSFFEDLLIETSLISPCYKYRFQDANESEIQYGLRVANELEDEIIRLGPDNVMAFIAETVVRATAVRTTNNRFNTR